MEVEKTPQQIEDERIETILLYVVAESFGREHFRSRYQAIITLMKAAKSIAEAKSGKILTSIEAFTALCQKQVDFRGLID